MAPYTRFSRIYRDAIQHGRYNCREVGVYVAEKVLEQHIWSSVESKLASDRSDVPPGATKTLKPLPVFSHAITVMGELPGGYFFFLSSAPKLAGELSPLITGDTHDDNICVLSLDYLGTVQSFAYFGRGAIEEKNLSQLVNYHESMLNSAMYSYEQGYVTDWIAFFREDWAMILFHDKFGLLVKHLRSSMRNDKGVISMLDKIFEIADGTPDDHQVAIQRRKLFGERGELLSEVTRKSIETQVIEFLRENKNTLPRYYIPQISTLSK